MGVSDRLLQRVAEIGIQRVRSINIYRHFKGLLFQELNVSNAYRFKNLPFQELTVSNAYCFKNLPFYSSSLAENLPAPED